MELVLYLNDTTFEKTIIIIDPLILLKSAHIMSVLYRFQLPVKNGQASVIQIYSRRSILYHRGKLIKRYTEIKLGGGRGDTKMRTNNSLSECATKARDIW